MIGVCLENCVKPVMEKEESKNLLRLVAVQSVSGLVGPETGLVLPGRDQGECIQYRYRVHHMHHICLCSQLVARRAACNAEEIREMICSD